MPTHERRGHGEDAGDVNPLFWASIRDYLTHGGDCERCQPHIPIRCKWRDCMVVSPKTAVSNGQHV